MKAAYALSALAAVIGLVSIFRPRRRSRPGAESRVDAEQVPAVAGGDDPQGQAEPAAPGSARGYPQGKTSGSRGRFRWEVWLRKGYQIVAMCLIVAVIVVLLPAFVSLNELSRYSRHWTEIAQQWLDLYTGADKTCEDWAASSTNTPFTVYLDVGLDNTPSLASKPAPSIGVIPRSLVSYSDYLTKIQPDDTCAGRIVCLDHLVLQHDTLLFQFMAADNATFEIEERPCFCNDKSKTQDLEYDYVFPLGVEWLDRAVDYHRGRGYYPFEIVKANLTVYLSGTFPKTSGLNFPVRIAPQVKTSVHADGWDTACDVEIIHDSVRGPTDHTSVQLTFRRPVMVRLMTTLLILVLAAIIIFLPNIEELGTFLEVTVGVVFGLWGVNQILIPEGIHGPSLIEYAIMSLYCLLAFSVLVKLVVHWRSSKDKCPQENQ